MSKTLLLKNQQTKLCEKRPVTSLFWYVFSCIRIEYTVNLRIKSEYRKILTRKNSVFRDFSCSTRCFYNGQFFRKLFSGIKALTDKFLHLHERHLIKQKHLRSVINRSWWELNWMKIPFKNLERLHNTFSDTPDALLLKAAELHFREAFSFPVTAFFFSQTVSAT